MSGDLKITAAQIRKGKKIALKAQKLLAQQELVARENGDVKQERGVRTRPFGDADDDTVAFYAMAPEDKIERKNAAEKGK